MLADLVKRGAERVFACVPCPALLVTSKMLRILHRHCGCLGHRRRALWTVFALAYFTLMSQSNLLSPALGGWGGPHTIRRQDVVPALGSLRVTIVSSKTIKTRAQAVALFIPSIPDSPYCPVTAWYGALFLNQKSVNQQIFHL